MKTLVSFYSQTGNTKKVAQQIAQILKANIDEIHDLKNRKGIFGFLSGGKDAIFKKQTTIKNKLNPENYDLIIIGTPVWAGNMTPAIRTYFCKYEFKKLSFFCTCDSSQSNTFKEMMILSKKPITTLEINSKELNQNKHKEKIKQFCEKIKQYEN